MSTRPQQPPVEGGANRIIIVGGGLAGVCAAHAALQHGGSVLLLDKSAFLGGNSTKASSGIAGSPTQAQIDAGVLDGVKLFTDDTNRSFHGVKPGEQPGPVSPLVSEMVRLSGSSLDWLAHYFNCDLTKLGFMGGHSKPRTHRGEGKPPGMAITFALINALEKVQKEDPARARILTKARVVRLVRDPVDGPVTGVVYADRKGNEFMERGAVIVATGGFAADFTQDDTSLIARFAPQLTKFATTNAEHATGDGIKIGEQIGAGLVDMDRIQVHPSGLVDPKCPDNHVKFLCAEALRGAGGIVVDKKGQRFVDELARRDQASGAMLQNNDNSPFYLLLNEKSAKEMESHCKHYEGRGLMTRYASSYDFCKAANIKPEALAATYEQYKKDAAVNAASRGVAAGSDGAKPGFFTSLFGLGKSSGSGGSAGAGAGAQAATRGTPDRFGKTLFRNVDAFAMTGPLYVAWIAPVVHYTMGGLHVNEYAEVLDAATQKPIPGLYCAGEAAGGVHGKNRLGGNSLLDCVVYGRVAGERATKYLLATYMGPFSNNRLNTIYSQLTIKELPALPPVPKAAAVTTKAAVAATEAPAEKAAAAPAAAAGASEGGKALKRYTRAEVAKHNKEADCWCIIHGQVLNLTEFLPDHPGGKQSVVMYAGKDATEAFDLVHQAEVIEKYTPDAVVGVVSD
ncbi:flavoprotein subunit-like protein [Leptomonas pyrrhocoris]|uniref:Flavoprotein subunit-like protein n=1 Tax=Leptomonas pyrrhocoris TaxID=157538 RepID=A0A0N0DRD2_LEPPY|nr:flavoprotein subunit-like protein [Leptomonas pyrrhocoris]KPA74284.1 flavoprotein subunit-like protein [Leptomonas pyrrhocoris]|eukprot:XP_015652723.1 flavoprotein subunit-like protein [Leptomonas pyrrhocoris]